MKTVKNKNLKRALTVALLLCVVATLTTRSRGAFIGLVAITFLWLINEKKKWPMIVTLACVAPALYAFLPSTWFDRMQTIETYDQDNSAMGRILAWRFAAELSAKRFIGGGFGTFVEETYRQYAPDVVAEIEARDGRFQNAHSIYFSVLGEHGAVGIILFLAIGGLTLKKSRRVQKAALEQGDSDLALLAAATRTGLVGYAVCGAFQNLAYFDLYYDLVAIIVILDRELLAKRERSPAVLGRAPGGRALIRGASGTAARVAVGERKHDGY
jgi:probable O-glycosylation ligase (exosortase A-associated)